MRTKFFCQSDEKLAAFLSVLTDFGEKRASRRIVNSTLQPQSDFGSLCEGLPETQKQRTNINYEPEVGILCNKGSKISVKIVNIYIYIFF